MRAFMIELENRPGRMAELCEALGMGAINISSVAGVTVGDRGAMAMVTSEEAGTRATLEERGDDYSEVELVSASLEDRPGSLGEAARRLADRGVNIELLIPMGMSGNRVTVAFGVDDPSAAREALGELVATGATAG